MFRELAALMRREALRYVRTPIWIVSSLMIPLLYLVLFGQGFNLGKLFPGGGGPALTAALLGAPNYFSYFCVGMVGFVALTMALFSGATIIFDKELGVQQRLIATPAPRAALFAAPLLFRSVMGCVPAFLVLALSAAFAHIRGLVGLTVTANVTALGVAEIVGATLLLSIGFNSLFIAFGFALSKPDSYFGIVNMLNLPILFTSNALYPQSTMPAWLQNIVAYNPVSLTVNVLRENLFQTDGYLPYGPGVYLLGLVGWVALIMLIALVIARRALSQK
jgi:ABC-2 type transport system permease protein